MRKKSVKNFHDSALTGLFIALMFFFLPALANALCCQGQWAVNCTDNGAGGWDDTWVWQGAGGTYCATYQWTDPDPIQILGSSSCSIKAGSWGATGVSCTNSMIPTASCAINCTTNKAVGTVSFECQDTGFWYWGGWDCPDLSAFQIAAKK